MRDAIGQHATAAGNSAHASCTLASNARGNGTFGFSVYETNNVAGTTAGSGFASVATYADSTYNFMGEFTASNVTVVDTTNAASIDWGIIGLEIVAPAGGGSPIVFRKTLSRLGTRAGSREAG